MRRQAPRALATLGVVVVLGIAACGPQPVRPSPSLLADALRWSPDRARQDWPLPVRAEPAGEPQLTTLEPAEQEPTGQGLPSFSDPAGDVVAPGWLDVTTVRVNFAADGNRGTSSRVEFDLAAGAPNPFPDPPDGWVAYGMVVDIDGDGHGDLRLGMDNAPDAEHRAWWTDLATGLTEATTGGPYGLAGRYYFDTFLPGERPGGGLMLFSADDVGEFKFYVWASLIVDGEAVATDYAPNVGWLDPHDPQQ